MDSRDVQFKAGRLLEVYRDGFKSRFGQEPVVDIASDMEDLRWVVEKVGFDRGKALLQAYFLIQSDWITEQGFSIRWFKNNINRVITQTALTSQTGGHRPKYVVAISVSGYPTSSHYQNEMGPNYWFKPMLWNDWVKASYENRAQGDPHLNEWAIKWKEWNFLEEH